MKRQYDVDGVVRHFLDDRSTDRAELVSELTAGFRDSKAVRELSARVAEEVTSQRMSPEKVIAIGLMYGMAVGVRLEQLRRRVVLQ